MWIEVIQACTMTSKSMKTFKDPYIYTLGNEMIDTCDEMHRKQYKQLRKLFIPLCLESHDRYYFNVLIMITLFYHFYVEHEIYAMAYKNQINYP